MVIYYSDKVKCISQERKTGKKKDALRSRYYKTQCKKIDECRTTDQTDEQAETRTKNQRTH